jgi:hypothetical protein
VECGSTSAGLIGSVPTKLGCAVERFAHVFPEPSQKIAPSVKHGLAAEFPKGRAAAPRSLRRERRHWQFHTHLGAGHRQLRRAQHRISRARYGGHRFLRWVAGRSPLNGHAIVTRDWAQRRSYVPRNAHICVLFHAAKKKWCQPFAIRHHARCAYFAQNTRFGRSVKDFLPVRRGL